MNPRCKLLLLSMSCLIAVTACEKPSIEHSNTNTTVAPDTKNNSNVTENNSHVSVTPSSEQAPQGRQSTQHKTDSLAESVQNSDSKSANNPTSTIDTKFRTDKSTAVKPTDFTALLKPMMAGCDYPDLSQGMPQPYQVAILDKNVEGEVTMEGKEQVITYSLNNASAFGQPLDKIVYLQGYEWNEVTLYFKNPDFMNLRPQFKLPKLPESAEVISDDGKGYVVSYQGEIYLEFDAKKNTIVCGYGV